MFCEPRKKAMTTGRRFRTCAGESDSAPPDEARAKARGPEVPQGLAFARRLVSWTRIGVSRK